MRLHDLTGKPVNLLRKLAPLKAFGARGNPSSTFASHDLPSIRRAGNYELAHHTTRDRQGSEDRAVWTHNPQTRIESATIVAGKIRISRIKTFRAKKNEAHEPNPRKPLLYINEQVHTEYLSTVLNLHNAVHHINLSYAVVPLSADSLAIFEHVNQVCIRMPPLWTAAEISEQVKGELLAALGMNIVVLLDSLKQVSELSVVRKLEADSSRSQSPVPEGSSRTVSPSPTPQDLDVLDQHSASLASIDDIQSEDRMRLDNILYRIEGEETMKVVLDRLGSMGSLQVLRIGTRRLGHARMDVVEYQKGDAGWKAELLGEGDVVALMRSHKLSLI
ncbi:hypothetical protein LTS18_002938 [Coniosporium uncinatum]|uniref:Uncharacterized protein n=1 Tax=Coniosporium uncinatum TaxID=93489 RepID=A0ACC3DZH4_9PEZI|nr:hypothetical protein LTS18_002938 [Coniosporium uncinatum]